jgi:hypothetical protein
MDYGDSIATGNSMKIRFIAVAFLMTFLNSLAMETAKEFNFAQFLKEHSFIL